MKTEINIKSSFPDEELSDLIREIFYLQIDSDREQTMVAIDDGCYDFMFYKEKYANLEFEHINTVKIASNFLTVHQLNTHHKSTYDQCRPFLNHHPS